MGKIIAKAAILYRGRSYKPGEALPCNDPKMVDAWLRAGTAAEEGKKPEAEKAEDKKPKAKKPAAKEEA